MNMQEKFQAAMQKIADERDLDLVVEAEWANTGWFSFQPRDAFEPLLRLSYNFQDGYSSFAVDPQTGTLARGARGSAWRGVRGGEHERVIAWVRSMLDGAPGTVRIVVLPDGETWGFVEGARICEIPGGFDISRLKEALADGVLRCRELR
jgi:hypothetical protein